MTTQEPAADDARVQRHDTAAGSVAESVALAIGAGLLIIAAVVDILYGPWDHDGGFFLLRASYVAAGLRPYLDYVSIYPPMMDLLDALPMLLPIDRFALAIAIPLGWELANLGATFALGWSLTRRVAPALLLSVLWLLFTIDNGGNHLTLEHGVVLFSLLTLLCGLARRPRAILMFAGGAFACCALLCKQNGAVVVLPLLALQWQRRDELPLLKSILAAMAGGASVLLAMATWLDWRLGTIAANIVGKLARYAAESPRPGGVLAGEFLRSPWTAVLLLCVLALGATMSLRAAPGRNRLFLASLVLFGIVEFLPRFLRDYPHYNLNVWPAAAALLAIALTTGTPHAKQRLRLLFLTMALLGFLLVAQSGHLSGRGRLVSRFQPAAEAIAAVSSANTPIRQYGTESILEFLARRRQERISMPDSTFARWDGTGIYDGLPRRGIPVVIVDEGRPWVAPVVSQYEAAGYRRIYHSGTLLPRISIYLDRPTFDRRVDAASSVLGGVK